MIKGHAKAMSHLMFGCPHENAMKNRAFVRAGSSQKSFCNWLIVRSVETAILQLLFFGATLSRPRPNQKAAFRPGSLGSCSVREVVDEAKARRCRTAPD